MALLSVIVLGAATFHIAGVRFFHSSEMKAPMVIEVNFILDYISKYAAYATGDPNNDGIRVPNATTLRIRTDVGPTGSPFNTPGDYSDDNWVEFRTDPGDSHCIQFCENFNIGTTSCTSGYNNLSFKVVSYQFSNPVENEVHVTNLILRDDPSAGFNFRTNPQVSTGASALVFTSLVYSLN